jgi:hypothetical protein
VVKMNQKIQVATPATMISIMTAAETTEAGERGATTSWNSDSAMMGSMK